jgi:two-component system sensor histidine kinase/response regulator
MSEHAEHIPGKVLIVDDNPSNLQLIANALSSMNIELLYATNGMEALTLAVENRPELILLDIMMPGIDGFTTCRRIRAEPKTRDIPVLFITAKSDEDSIIQGFESGGQDYITKPFNLQELKARVLTHLHLRLANESLKRMNITLGNEVTRLRALLKSLNTDLSRFKTDLGVYFEEEKP